MNSESIYELVTQSPKPESFSFGNWLKKSLLVLFVGAIGVLLLKVVGLAILQHLMRNIV